MEDNVFIFEEEQIRDLAAEADKVKGRHRTDKVYLIEVEGDEEGDKTHRAWLRKPTLKTMSAFYTASQQDPIIAAKVVFNDCFLEGDREITDDDEIFMGAMNQIEELMKVRRARLVKF